MTAEAAGVDDMCRDVLTIGQHMSRLQSHGTPGPLNAQRLAHRTVWFLLDGEGTWQSPQQTVPRSIPARGRLAATAITLPVCGRRLLAPAAFPVFMAGVCRTSVRPSSASAGAISPRPVRLQTNSASSETASHAWALSTISRPCSMRPSLTSLHVCSPHGLHAAHAIEAVNRGINVIIEKPMATSKADARALMAATEAAGVDAAVCLTKRSYPMVAEMRARILAGELGEVNAVRGGFLSWDSNHDVWGWGFDATIAGTSYATADLGVHWLDLAEYVTGRRITEVDARFATLRPVRYRDSEPIKIDAEDYVRLFLEFSGGAVGSATFSGVTAGEPNGCSIDVDGTDGGFHWKVDRPNEIIHRRADGSVEHHNTKPRCLGSSGRSPVVLAGRSCRGLRRRLPESVSRRLFGDRWGRRLLSDSCRRVSHGCHRRGDPNECTDPKGGRH